MKQMKLPVILVIVACLMVGAGSGGFLDEPSESPSRAAVGLFDDYKPVSFGDGWLFPGYEPITFGDGWLHPGYVPFNLSDWLYPEPAPALPDDKEPTWEPVPLVMPEPMPLSKAELFGSLTTVSESKQSLLSSMNRGGKGLQFPTAGYFG